MVLHVKLHIYTPHTPYLLPPTLRNSRNSVLHLLETKDTDDGEKEEAGEEKRTLN